MTLQVMQISGFSQWQQSGKVRHRNRSDPVATVAAQAMQHVHTPARQRAGVLACVYAGMPARSSFESIPAVSNEAGRGFRLEPRSAFHRFIAGMDELRSRPCVIIPECKRPRQHGSGRFGVIVGRIILPVERRSAAATTLPAYCHTIMRRRTPDTEASERSWHRTAPTRNATGTP